MTDTTIHNIRVSYDESDERVRNFIHYLKNESRKEELLADYEKTQQAPENQIYLEDSLGNEFTFFCGKSHNCSLKLRGM